MTMPDHAQADHEGLLIRADASTQLGAGHAMRCFALAKAWQKSGGRVTVAMSEALPGMQDRFRNQGIRVEHVSSEGGSKEDAKQTGALGLRIGARWTVVDGYHFEAAYVRHLRDAGQRVLLFDDYGCFGEYCSDVVLNQNLGAREEMYLQRSEYTKLLLGTDYALLRPEFLGIDRFHEPVRATNRLLVCMGGSDAENVTEKAIQAVAQVGGKMQTTVVVGSGNPHQEQLRGLAARLPGVRIQHNPANMAELMCEADLAVSAAGSTCWELAYLGVPMIVTAIAKNQEKNAQALSERGAAINLGWHENASLTEISNSIGQLAGDVVRRRAMSQAARNLVDGLGAKRVINVLRGAAA